MNDYIKTDFFVVWRKAYILIIRFISARYNMRLRKKILALWAIVIGLGGFWIVSWIPITWTVYAQTENTTTSSMEDNFRDLADVFLKMAYVLLWPLIFLSGIALDNTMVYGSIFHMDTPLRQFRNLCKNFANFGLWFMIIAAVGKSVFSKWWTKPVVDTIKKAIIAGIVIQLSRFLVAAIIDISTIATYAVGWMPMSILKTDANMAKTKILQSNVDLNLNSEKKMQVKDFIIYRQVKKQDWTTIKISPCETKKSDSDQKYIIWRTYGDERFRNEGKISTELDKWINACVYQNEVKFFYEFPDLVNLTGQAYETKRNEIIQLWDRDWWEACGYVLKLDGIATTKTCSTSSFITESKDAQEYEWYNNPPQSIKINKNDGSTRFTNSAATSIGEIIDKSKGFVGPLATIYTSLLDFAQLSDATNTNWSSEWKWVGELMIRTAISAGLILPLLALTIVLVIRIGFLRCIIWASPLIVLIKSFDLGSKLWNLGKQIEIKNIISVIFAPVITVFALSICLVFMTTLISTYKPHDDLSTKGFTQALSSFGIQQTKGTDWDKYDTLNIMGFVLRYDKSLNSYAWASGDWFSRMIICFAGIWVMWFVLFAAIKASGLIGESVGKQIQTFGQNTLSTLPILSLPGMKSKVWVGTLFDKTIWNNGETLGKNVTDLRNNKFVNLPWQEKEVDRVMDDLKGNNVWKKTIELIENNNYSSAVEKLTDKEKWKATTDEIVNSIKTYTDVETFIRGLEGWKKKEVLIGLWGDTLWTKRQNMEEKEDAKEKFEKILGTPKNKAELDTILAKDEAKKLAEKDNEYKIEVTMAEDPKDKYTISVDTASSPKKLKADKETPTK